MTLLAHWRFDEGSAHYPITAVDVAAGGGGSHSGTYRTASGIHGLLPGGVNGKRFYNRPGNIEGTVDTISNPADLRLLGALTCMAWIAPHVETVWKALWTANAPIVGCTGTDETEAQNDLFLFQAVNQRALQLFWENGLGVDVTVTSINDILPHQTPSHVAVVRYEVVPAMWGVKFYVNGVLADTQNNGGAGWNPPTGGGSSLPYLGRTALTHSSNSFLYDAVRVYDSEEALSSIQAVYAAERVWYENLPILEQGQFSERTNAGFSL